MIIYHIDNIFEDGERHVKFFSSKRIAQAYIRAVEKEHGKADNPESVNIWKDDPSTKPEIIEYLNHLFAY